MSVKIVFVSKVCQARKGRGRVWIEGERLRARGWKPKQAFVTSGSRGFLTLEKAPPARAVEGQKVRHVAGTAERPVIDIVGATVADSLGRPGTQLVVQVTEKQIVVESKAR